MSLKKQIFELSILRKLLNDANSCVSLVPSTRLLALPPFFLNDMKSGIFYLLNSILKKYDRSLDGIVIGYQNVKILMDENTGIIPIGSAETEVNVSVDFYIFQPKIGNTLEGVINKKSNNHIGCLVHQYFNATILRPEDVKYENWNCKDFDVNDKILFKVKDLDFTGLLPYIEGIVCNEELLQCTKSKIMDGCDLDVHKDFQGETLSESTRQMKKKKKKKEKEKDERILKSSKKKEEESIFPDFILQKYLHLDSDNDFVTSVSKKKEKKKKGEKIHSSLNKIVEGASQKNELFYSTQLEPISECKMNTSCSPIPKQMSDLDKNNSETSMLCETKRKDKKRKAEDSSHASAKKSKKDRSQINGMAESMDKFSRPELNKVKEMLSVSEKREEEKHTSKRDSIYAKLMEDVKNEISFDKNNEADSDSTRSRLKKKKKKKHKEHKTRPKDQKLKNGSMYDIDLSPEKINSEKNFSSEPEPNGRSTVKKKDEVASIRKSLIQTMLDQFFVEEGKKLRSDSDRESAKESTSKQKKELKISTSSKESKESLYEKLLREAKSRIEMNEDSVSKKKRKRE